MRVAAGIIPTMRGVKRQKEKLMTAAEFLEVLLLAVALSMDAFAVSMCKGLAMPKATYRDGFVCGAWFGGFQGLMPVAGFFLGSLFYEAIKNVDHWIAFGLLAIIGINMLREAFSNDCECHSADMSAKTMFVMAVATSIDAMAAGISMAMDQTNIWVAASLIAVITCSLCTVGVKIGGVVGCKYEKKAQIAGGVVLILLGLKILAEHLGWLPW